MESSTFTLAAEPNTDIWKKPPSHDVFNAPYRVLAKRPTSTFQSASLTFSAPYVHQFDQAGLLLIFSPPSSSASFSSTSSAASPSASAASRKWIKAGIEFFNGQPRLSAVACDAWSDWSVAPIPASEDHDIQQGASLRRDVASGARPVTLRVGARREGPGDVTMWIHYVQTATAANNDNEQQQQKEEKEVLVPMRELCWPFGEAAGPGWQLEIAAAVARPSKDVEGKLEATFKDFQVEWA